jgi:DNA-binding transcriptional regulator LsrR (DeoR family)
MSYDLQLMYDVANLYYTNNLKQESIARRLNISKYKVSRVLKRALDEGIVQIRVVKLEDKILDRSIKIKRASSMGL